MSAAGALTTYVALCVTPAAFFGVVAAALSPNDNRLKRMGGWMAGHVAALRSGADQVPPLPDPFEALKVQLRLERLAAEIAAIDASPRPSARGHHRRAALAAYDDLLAEACRMAGIELPEVEPGPVRRLLQEAELRSRGW